MLDYYHFKDIDVLFTQGKVLEARNLLAEMQTRYLAVCDENYLLRTQLHEFEDILHMARNLVFDGICYWLITGGIKQGPFCRQCYDRDGALIRIDVENDQWKCLSCGAIHNRNMPF